MLQERNNNFILFNSQLENSNNNVIPLALNIPLDNKPSINKFIFNTIKYLYIQHSFTFIGIISLYNYRNVILPNINKYILWPIISIIVFINTIVILICCNIKNSVLQHILFIIFIISSTLFLGYITIHYNLLIILQCSFTTLIIIFITLIYSTYCYLLDQEYNITIGNIINILFSFIITGLISLLIPFNSIFTTIICILYNILFIIYFHYDIRVLYNKNNVLILQYPIITCIYLYLDIFNIFKIRFNI